MCFASVLIQEPRLSVTDPVNEVMMIMMMMMVMVMIMMMMFILSGYLGKKGAVICKLFA